MFTYWTRGYSRALQRRIQRCRIVGPKNDTRSKHSSSKNVFEAMPTYDLTSWQWRIRLFSIEYRANFRLTYRPENPRLNNASSRCPVRRGGTVDRLPVEPLVRPASSAGYGIFFPDTKSSFPVDAVGRLTVALCRLTAVTSDLFRPLSTTSVGSHTFDADVLSASVLLFLIRKSVLEIRTLGESAADCRRRGGKQNGRPSSL